jgi:hypothetical protein
MSLAIGVARQSGAGTSLSRALSWAQPNDDESDHDDRSKRPFAGPEAVLAYLSRYTHRGAISNSRLVAFDQHGVMFRWKDYRRKGQTRCAFPLNGPRGLARGGH